MTTFTQRLKQLYEEAPDHVSVRLLHNHQPEQAITYRDLLHGAAGYAHALQKTGIRPGEVVVLILQHGEALIHAFFGAILHGAIPAIMPFLTEKLSPDQYARSLAALFEITKPAAVITYPEFLEDVKKAIQPGSSPRSVLLSTEISGTSTLNLASLQGFSSTIDDIVLLQHSSGTTGLQKGVALSHRAVFNQIESYTQAIQLNAQDVIVSWLPLYHDMGLIAGFVLPILSNVPLVLISPFDWVRAPHKLFQAISSYKGTLTWLPNFAYNFCALKIRERDLEGVDLSTWRAVINCSEPMYWKSHQLFTQRFQSFGFKPQTLATCYAMAENVFAVTQGGIDTPVSVDCVSQRVLLNDHIAQPALDGEPSLNMLSAGKPIINTQLRVLDENQVDLLERHIGEIALQSDCMLTGYYHHEELTTQSFHEGWYLTGDLGYLAAGELYITGRKKDLIIVGGKNIYPQDLENLASDVPGIHPGRVAAFGVPNETTGTEDVVIVAEIDSTGYTPEQDTQPNVSLTRHQQIANEIRQRVTRGSDIALRYVKIVERGWLLKTSSGKVARNANREKYLASIRQ